MAQDSLRALNIFLICSDNRKPRFLRALACIFLSFFLVNLSSAQKVGLVLSGGGAKGIAHIGVLKALEENDIPIDYITGSSSGAIIGGMYASGYSVEEIEGFFLSEEFTELFRGNIEEQYNYFFKKPEENAAWVSLPFSLQDIRRTTLPTNLISPDGLNFELMKAFGPPSIVSGENFDNLMVPFRCVASDIENKVNITFRDGNLSEAIRASMSYPFYFRPITVEGKVLFDGGLYNNFPTDVMRDEFKPGYIIGSNVSSNEEPPEEDDVISILRNMMVSKTNYALDSTQGLVIEPEVLAGTFDFEHLAPLIDSGYQATLRNIDYIKEQVGMSRTKDEVNRSRVAFRQKMRAVEIDRIEVMGVTKNQARYIRAVLQPGKAALTLDEVKKRYYRLVMDKKVTSVFPKLVMVDSSYVLSLDVDLEKSFTAEFGGVFSSRPINTGYVGLRYSYLGRFSYSLEGSSYFGKFYNNGELRGRVDFANPFVLSAQPYFKLSRFNYFQSLSTFFELDKPSYLIQNELYYGLDLSFPVGSNAKLTVGALNGNLKDQYYQTQNFNALDFPDETDFAPTSFSLKFEKNTLNYKLYANKGMRWYVGLRYSDAVEEYRPGTTSVGQSLLQRNHQWLDFKFQYDHYYKQTGNIRFGALFELVYSGLGRMSNYTESSLRSPSFNPIPISQTIFLESFRAYQYAAIGHKFIFDIKNKFDVRLEGYLFQPYRRLNRINISDFEIIQNFEKRFTMATASLVYQSPLGPLSLSANYYFNIPEIGLQDEPVTVLVHFGYLIFNRRALD